jgi:hypothetical protein
VVRLKSIRGMVSLYLIAISNAEFLAREAWNAHGNVMAT